MPRTHRSKRLSLVTIAATFGSSGLTACSGLLDVTLPGRVEAAVLDNPALAGTLVQSAIADFECAFDTYIAMSALLTDEMQHASTGADTRTWDLRNIGPDYTANATLPCGNCCEPRLDETVWKA